MRSRLRDKSLGFLLTLAATGKKVQVIQSSYIVFPLETPLLQVFCNTTDVMVKARKFPSLQISKPLALSHQLQEGGPRRGCLRRASMSQWLWSLGLSQDLGRWRRWKSSNLGCITIPVFSLFHHLPIIRTSGILFCTDVCSMGVDIPDLLVGVSLGKLATIHVTDV